MSLEEFRDIKEKIISNENEPTEYIEINFWGWFLHLENFIKTHLVSLDNEDKKSNLWKDGLALCFHKKIEKKLYLIFCNFHQLNFCISCFKIEKSWDSLNPKMLRAYF